MKEPWNAHRFIDTSVSGECSPGGSLATMTSPDHSSPCVSTSDTSRPPSTVHTPRLTAPCAGVVGPSGNPAM